MRLPLMTQKELWEIEATAPRSNQEFWGEAVRLWPALRAERHDKPLLSYYRTAPQ